MSANINSFSILNTVAANAADVTVSNLGILDIAGKGGVDLRSLTSNPSGFTAPVAAVPAVWTLTVAGTGSLIAGSTIGLLIEQQVDGKFPVSEEISYYVPSSGATQASVYTALNEVLSAAGQVKFDFTTSGATPNVITAGANSPLLKITVTDGAGNISSLVNTTAGVAAVGFGADLILQGIPVANSADYYGILTLNWVDNNENAGGAALEQTRSHTFYVDVNTGGATPTAGANYSLLASVVAAYLEDGIVVANRESFAANATATLTAGQLQLGLITSTSASATTLTLPTATQVATQLGASAGSEFSFIIDNSAGANTVTVAVGSGITVPTTAVTGGVSLTVSTAQVAGKFSLYFTSATAAIIHRVW